jgi:transposase
MRTRRRFSREFKVEAVKLVCERGMTIAQAARDLDVHASVLRNWVREPRADPAHIDTAKGCLQNDETPHQPKPMRGNVLYHGPGRS